MLGVTLASAPQVGEPAPDFRAVDSEGQHHVLSEMVKKGPVVLAFFVKAYTPG